MGRPSRILRFRKASTKPARLWPAKRIPSRPEAGFGCPDRTAFDRDEGRWKTSDTLPSPEVSGPVATFVRRRCRISAFRQRFHRFCSSCPNPPPKPLQPPSSRPFPSRPAIWAASRPRPSKRCPSCCGASSPTPSSRPPPTCTRRRACGPRPPRRPCSRAGSRGSSRRWASRPCSTLRAFGFTFRQRRALKTARRRASSRTSTRARKPRAVR